MNRRIALCRVDSRLVHGQVVTKWVNQVNANQLIVVDDNLINDPFLLSIYEMSAPPGMELQVFSVNDSIEKIKNLNERNRVLLLFADISTLMHAYDKGLELAEVQIGGLGGGPNRKAVYQNITLDKTDFDNLSDLSSKGVKITFQSIPEDKPISFEEIKNKF